MTETQPKRKYRLLRSAPHERPVLPVTAGLRSEVEEIAGPHLGALVLEALQGEVLPGTPEEFQRFEERLLSIARQEFVGRVLVSVVEEVHRHDDFVLWSMAAARRRGARLRGASDREVRVCVAGGHEVRIMTPYMQPLPPVGKPGPRRKSGDRGDGGGGLFPVLASLGVVCHASPHVASEAARGATLLASFDEAAEALERQGPDLAPETVRRLTERVADAGLADREAAEPIAPRYFAGKRVVICPDGGRLRCRIEKVGRRRDSGYHGYETPWLEPKVFAAYTIDENGDKIAAELPVYEGTLAPWKDAVEIVASTLRRFGIQHADTIAIAADGSENIWREVDRFVELLGVDRSKVVFFVDFYHAAEHLSAAAKLSTRLATDQQRQQWVRKQTKRLRGGRVEVIVHEMAALPTASPEALEELQKECEYFRSRVHLMRYDVLRRQGLPIGTGAVESAIRRIVNLRMKGPGIFWTPENAERMLYLRCRAKAGRWEEVEAALHRAALLPERDTQPHVFQLITAAAA